MIEWVSLSKGGKVTAIDTSSGTLVTDFGRHKGRRHQHHSDAESRPHRATLPASPTAPAGARSIR